MQKWKLFINLGPGMNNCQGHIFHNIQGVKDACWGSDTFLFNVATCRYTSVLLKHQTFKNTQSFCL